MINETYISLILFSFSASITPGPNNIMLLNSGAKFGPRKSLPHVLGVSIGLSSMVLALGLGLVRLLQVFPTLYLFLKVLPVRE